VVTDEAGEPAGGVFITTSPGGYEATTDAAGAFEIGWLLPGELSVVAAAAGWSVAQSEGVQVIAGETAHLVVSLVRADPSTGALTVRVDGPDGEPLEDASVVTSLGGEATTDAAGEARLFDLGGQTVSLRIEGEIDGDHALWGRSVSDLQIPDGGGAQVHVQLSGRPGPDAVFTGDALCSFCHAETVVRHQDSPHGRALSDGPSAALGALFDAGIEVDLGGPVARLTGSADSPSVTLVDAGGIDERTHAVAGWLGDAEDLTVPWAEIDGAAFPLPIGWVPADPDQIAAGYAESALVPFETDRFFSSDGAFSAAKGAGPPASRSAEASCFPCHVSGFELTAQADGGAELVATNTDGARWDQGWVGCERCHGPGSQHAEAASDSRRPFLITQPQNLDVDRGNEVCGQCHAATVGSQSGLPFPDGDYLPGERLDGYAVSTPDLWASGAAAAPAQQLDELNLSPHGPDSTYPMRCFDCHDSHSSGEAALRVDHEDNSLCADCHAGLSFGSDQATRQHDPHEDYDPTGETATGRCTRCHMPSTSARLAFDARSGGGQLASHLFETLPPQDTVDAFDAAGATELEVGEFPAHGCGECHAWSAWLYAQRGDLFPGPSGAATLRQTHVEHQSAFEGMFP